MAKKKTKNFYAIHFINDRENVVVKKWSQCQELTKGRNNMFKGFMTEEEAWDWLNSITPSQEKWHDEKVAQKRAAKKIKSDLVEYRFRIDKKLSDDLQKELSALHLPIDKLMDDLIREYLYGEE